jgi:hypothetical protein
VKTTTIGLLSSRGHKHRSGTHAKAPSAAKRRPAPSALSQDELLAKIDALDWDETVTPDAAPVRGGKANMQYPDHSTSNWRVAAIAVVIAVVLAASYIVFAPDSASRKTVDDAPTPISAAGSPAIASVDSQVPPEASAATVAAAEERRAALYAHAIETAELKAQKAEVRRKAREAERARLAVQQERERRQKDEARQRAERDAEEAARAAKAREPVAVPKGPSSPQELCAGEGGVIARGFCEARACGKAEWRSHPFCVKRLEEQLRSIGVGG